MTSCLTVVFVLLQVLVASKLSHGKYLRDIDIKEFQDLAGSTSGSFVAVYFDNAGKYIFFIQLQLRTLLYVNVQKTYVCNYA